MQSDKENSEKDKFKEAWLVDLTIDGKSKQLSRLIVQDSEKWTYSEQGDNYYFLPTDDENETNVFSFTVVGEKITLGFGANTWSGNIRIFDGDKIDQMFTLYNENPEFDRIEKTLDLSRNFSLFEQILYSSGAVIVLAFSFNVLFNVIIRFVEKQKNKKKQ